MQTEMQDKKQLIWKIDRRATLLRRTDKCPLNFAPDRNSNSDLEFFISPVKSIASQEPCFALCFRLIESVTRHGNDWCFQ